jgi:hypothetical protein
MRRRDLLSFGAGGYSLVVLADKLLADTPAPAFKPTAADFARIAPPDGSRRNPAEPHMTFVDLQSDIFIAGGGLAGVCAAISAARSGSKVVLVQDRSRLGGNSSSEVKMHVVGASCHKGRLGWRETGLLEEFRLDDAVNNPQRCWELWDILLYDKVVSEPNITLLLETNLYSAEMKNGQIESVLARCDKSEHLYRVRSKIYVDATGDSRLGIESGAEYRSGREFRSEFGESLAPETADKETLGSSILFTSQLHRKPMPFTPPKWARKVTKEHLKHRKVGPENWEYGYWWIEWGGNIDTIRDNERIRFELLAITMGVWDYIKNSGDFPDSANWALNWVGMMPGKRGSRRLVGDHLLTQHDLLKGSFEDAVAIGGWPLDDHPPGGFDRSDLPPNTTIKPPEVFDIPFRSLFSKNVPNLMMAGRNISATHAAFTSTRVMGTCATIGQAVGTAAAMCAERGILPRQLSTDRKLISSLQQHLIRDDQTIKTVRNTDPGDLARKAKITASAEAPGADAGLIVDGVLRDIPDDKGQPRELHHWGAPMTADGAWIELAWEKPQRIRRIQITFDSGLQRELTLSASDSVTRGTVRAAQPETVRDYAIIAKQKGTETEIARVNGNHQRVNRHNFEKLEADALRIHVAKTNGHDEARIVEVRCYA